MNKTTISYKLTSQTPHLIGTRVDEYVIYKGIAEVEDVEEHRVVGHGRREWAKGDIQNRYENRNGFLRTYLRKYRGVSKNYLQGYLDFLSLVLNERSKWFILILSDNLGG